MQFNVMWKVYEFYILPSLTVVMVILFSKCIEMNKDKIQINTLLRNRFFPKAVKDGFVVVC